MRIGIYDQASIRHINGIQASICILAAGLRDAGSVELVHHNPSLELDELARRYGVDLEGVGLRCIEKEPLRRSWAPWRRYEAVRDWCRSASEPYDLFVCFGGELPPFCRARNGVLMVIFPQPQKDRRSTSPVRRWSRRLYDMWEWRRRMGSYRLATANSAFTRGWTKTRWGIDCEVLYAPADLSAPQRSRPKSNLILSVGRFAAGAIDKKQREMMQVYRAMYRVGLDGWKYVSVGPLGRWEPAQRYFESVRGAAAECGAEAIPNVERSYLRELYAQAKIFWHATGYGVDVQRQPELTEHFGIATAEAMAAGCVPVVFNAGGQPEIVEHGVSGFVWDTLDELRDYTLRLIADEVLWARMSEAARERARRFGPEEYVARFRAACAAAGMEGLGALAGPAIDDSRTHATDLIRAVAE